MKLEFRRLKENEIECRIGTIKKDGSGLSLLLYKDARCDMNILDETVGATNWNKKYDLIVIDVMMPTQDTGASSELITGLCFYKKSIVDQYPQQKVLFWSNRSQEPFNQFFVEGKPDNVSFLRKDKNNPQQLLEEVIKIIGR